MNKPLIPKRHAVADFSGLRQKNKQPSLQGESLCYSSQQCVDTASQSRAFFFGVDVDGDSPQWPVPPAVASWRPGPGQPSPVQTDKARAFCTPPCRDIKSTNKMRKNIKWGRFDKNI